MSRTYYAAILLICMNAKQQQTARAWYSSAARSQVEICSRTFSTPDHHDVSHSTFHDSGSGSGRFTTCRARFVLLSGQSPSRRFMSRRTFWTRVEQKIHEWCDCLPISPSRQFMHLHAVQTSVVLWHSQSVCTISRTPWTSH